MDKLQQCYLMSRPVVATSTQVTVNLLDSYFKEQFMVNFNDDPKEFWQVFDRTVNEEVPLDAWTFDAHTGTVTINGTKKWHKYTVNFWCTASGKKFQLIIMLLMTGAIENT